MTLISVTGFVVLAGIYKQTTFFHCPILYVFCLRLAPQVVVISWQGDSNLCSLKVWATSSPA